MNDAMILKPLAGIRVLDFTAMPPGGACTVMLADLGAEVIRVEPPSGKGKPSLVVGQMALSRGKRSMTLDLRNPASIDVLSRLAPTIDVVVENAKPGAMEKRGFGYRQCSQINPATIWCAMTGFGQTGPYAAHAGHDLSFLAHSGLLGALSQELPWQPAISVALQAGAMSAVIAIQSAIIQRSHSGKGAFIDQSLSEAATWFLTCGINPLSDDPFVLPASPDRRLYRCADGRFVAVACAEPRTWNALCEGLGLPELKPHLHQSDQAKPTGKTLEGVFITRPATEWVNALAPEGVAITVVNHGAELLDDPHIRARESVAAAAGVPVPATPLHVIASDGARTGTVTAAPSNVGEDTRDILTDGGFSDEEIETLEQGGVI